MHKRQRKKAFEEIAPDSKLIRLINKLYNLSEMQEVRQYQEKINKLHLGYAVDCFESRLEFIDDLITSRKGNLDDSEKKALNCCLEDLSKKKDGDLTFSGFFIDCLSLTIREYVQAPSKTTALNFPYLNNIVFFNNGSSSGRFLLVLSLTGLLASGCTQKKDNSQYVYTGKKSMEILSTQKSDCNTGSHENNSDETGKTQNIKGPFVQTVHKKPENRNKALSEVKKTYIVKRGDSVRMISDEMGFDYRDLVRQNNIKYDKKRDWFMLYPGQVLVLPHGDQPYEITEKTAQEDQTKHAPGFLTLTSKKAKESFAYYLIEKGDSLWIISRKYKVPVEKIVEINKIRNPGKVRYGQMLKIPVKAENIEKRKPFNLLSSRKKAEFLKKRTIKAGHPYLETIVEMSEKYKIDPRLYAALIWEESWFDKNAKSKDNCQKLAQLDPRFHTISDDIKENFRKSLGYLRHEFVYYRKNGFDMKSSVISALAAYNGGNTRIRNYIKNGKWDGKSIETIPLKETRDHIKKVLHRCKMNYQASL